MNNRPATIAFGVGAFLFSIWVFHGFWSTLITTGLGVVAGFIVDSSRVNRL
jgi:uncharacterized membrane protein